MALGPPKRLRSGQEVEEIRTGVKSGLRGPGPSKWLEQLLADHGARVRLESERKG